MPAKLSELNLIYNVMIDQIFTSSGLAISSSKIKVWTHGNTLHIDNIICYSSIVYYMHSRQLAHNWLGVAMLLPARRVWPFRYPKLQMSRSEISNLHLWIRSHHHCPILGYLILMTMAIWATPSSFRMPWSLLLMIVTALLRSMQITWRLLVKLDWATENPVVKITHACVEMDYLETTCVAYINVLIVKDQTRLLYVLEVC